MAKPRIFVHFDGDDCNWFSDGWSNNEDLMIAARACIRDGNDPEEVVSLLETHFKVVILKEGALDEDHKA